LLLDKITGALNRLDKSCNKGDFAQRFSKAKSLFLWYIDEIKINWQADKNNDCFNSLPPGYLSLCFFKHSNRSQLSFVNDSDWQSLYNNQYDANIKAK